MYIALKYFNNFRIKTGALLLGPLATSTIWNGMPNNSNSGDAVVIYDEDANRWFISQLSLPNPYAAPYYVMVAVSQTADPTGSWYRTSCFPSFQNAYG